MPHLARTYVHARGENKYGKRRMAPTDRGGEERGGSYLAHSFGIRTQHKCGGKICEVVGICENRNWREESLALYSAAPIFFSLSRASSSLTPCTHTHARTPVNSFSFLFSGKKKRRRRRRRPGRFAVSRLLTGEGGKRQRKF